MIGSQHYQLLHVFHRSSIHSSTNYEPLRLFNRKETKIISWMWGVTRWYWIDSRFRWTSSERDITWGRNKLIYKFLLKMKYDIFDDAAYNIKKAQKREKKNYDIRHSGNKTKLDIGDMVVKEILVFHASKTLLFIRPWSYKCEHFTCTRPWSYWMHFLDCKYILPNY